LSLKFSYYVITICDDMLSLSSVASWGIKSAGSVQYYV
jgi:hypothetical protein